jgi:thiol:disulfide interchange protein DsbD
MSTRIAIAILITALAACSKQGKPSSELEGAGGQAATEETRAAETGASDEVASEDAKAIAWITDLEKARAAAKEQGRDLFIDISAEWCAPCKELEEVTFADPQMAKLLSDHYVPVNLDVTEQTDADLALMKRFGVTVLPALLVVRDEEILLTLRDFIGPSELAAKLGELPPRAK